MIVSCTHTSACSQYVGIIHYVFTRFCLLTPKAVVWTETELEFDALNCLVAVDLSGHVGTNTLLVGATT